MRRSDWRGFTIRFEVSSPSAYTRLEVGMDDGEPPFAYTMTSLDARYKRGEIWKPVRNGTWTAAVRLYDANMALVAHTTCPGVEVLP